MQLKKKIKNTFANSLDPHQDWQIDGPGLDPNCLTHYWYSLKICKKNILPFNLQYYFSVYREYCSTNDIHINGKPINRDTINRNSLLLLEAQNHKDPHRHNSYYGDDTDSHRHSNYYGEDVLATEV